MTAPAVLETRLRRCLTDLADNVTPSPTALEEIRAGIAGRPSLIPRVWSALTRAVPRKKELVVTIPIPMDPQDPTELPLRLLPTDVITRHPDSGEHGEWTFFKARDLGLRVLLECLAADGKTDVEFTVDRSASIHVAPRGGIDNFWGAA